MLCVVTHTAPGVVRLREWAALQPDDGSLPPPPSADRFTQVGMWRVPAAPAAPLAPPPVPAAGPGEFTRQFQAAAPPAPIAEPVPPAAPMAPPPAPVAGPGEFTRQFRAAAPPAPIAEPVTAAAPVVPPPVARCRARRVHAAVPGRCSARAIAEPVTPAAPVVPPPVPAAGPGEFTRQFQATAPPVPIAEPLPHPAPPPSEPGEFTRMFKTAAAVPVYAPAGCAAGVSACADHASSSGATGCRFRAWRVHPDVQNGAAVPVTPPPAATPLPPPQPAPPPPRSLASSRGCSKPRLAPRCLRRQLPLPALGHSLSSSRVHSARAHWGAVATGAARSAHRCAAARRIHPHVPGVWPPSTHGRGARATATPRPLRLRRPANSLNSSGRPPRRLPAAPVAPAVSFRRCSRQHASAARGAARCQWRERIQPLLLVPLSAAILPTRRSQPPPASSTPPPPLVVRPSR